MTRCTYIQILSEAFKENSSFKVQVWILFQFVHLFTTNLHASFMSCRNFYPIPLSLFQLIFSIQGPFSPSLFVLPTTNKHKKRDLLSTTIKNFSFKIYKSYMVLNKCLAGLLDKKQKIHTSNNILKNTDLSWPIQIPYNGKAVINYQVLLRYIFHTKLNKLYIFVPYIENLSNHVGIYNCILCVF